MAFKALDNLAFTSLPDLHFCYTRVLPSLINLKMEIQHQINELQRYNSLCIGQTYAQMIVIVLWNDQIMCKIALKNYK